MKKLLCLSLLTMLGISCVFAKTPIHRASGPGEKSTAGVLNMKKVSDKEARGTLPPSDSENRRTSSSALMRLMQSNSVKVLGHAEGKGPNVYAFMTRNDINDSPLGFYRVYDDGKYELVCSVPANTPHGNPFSLCFMWVRDGKLYALGRDMYYGMYVNANYLYVYDPATGERGWEELPIDAEILFQGVYVAEDDVFYGYYSDDDDNYHLGKAPGSDVTQVTEIAPTDLGSLGLRALTYNPESDKLIAIQAGEFGGHVLEIDPENGQITEVTTVTPTTRYATGITYSPTDDVYYYMYINPPEEGGCGIVTLDPSDYTTMSNVNYGGIIGFESLYCTDLLFNDPSAPTEAQLKQSDFPNGSLNGTLTYTLPNVTRSGTTILGNIDWVFSIDGYEVIRGSGNAGSEITVQSGTLTEGVHSFELLSSLGNRNSRKSKTKFYVGSDTPKAPENVTISTESINWSPVTEGIHNGYVNASDVTYNVYLNDVLVEQGIKGTNCASHIPTDKPLDFYAASVEAVFNNKVSERASSSDITYGEPYSVPFSMQPTEKESRLFTIVDANGTPSIEYQHGTLGGQPFSGFTYRYSTWYDADDYLFLPPVNFDSTSKVYEFTGSIFRSDAIYKEKFELLLCSSPDANPESVVMTILPEIDAPAAYEREPFANAATKAYFSVPEPGNYYVAVHVTSESNAYYVYMTEFSIRESDGIKLTSPMAATDLAATPKPNGELSATVSLTMPLNNVGNSPIDPNTTLTAHVQALNCAESTVTGNPGETVSVDIDTDQGENTIHVTMYEGDNIGLSAQTSVYTGVDIPKAVTNFIATPSQTAMGAHLTWDAPTTGVNGGYVAPTGNTYILCQWITVGTQSGWVKAGEIGTDVYECDVELPAGSEQDNYRFGITCGNTAGISEYVMVTSAVCGTPYVMPLVNDYTAGDDVWPVLNYTSGVTLSLDNSSDTWYPDYKTGGLTVLYPYYYGAIENGKITMPKVSTKDVKKPAFELDVYGGACKDFSIYVSSFDMPMELIKTYRQEDFDTPGRQKVAVDIPEKFLNKDWVEITLIYNTANRRESLIIFGWRYFDNLDNDFGVVNIEGSSLAKIGVESRYSASIINNSNREQPFPGGKWLLTDNKDNVMASVDVPVSTSPIAPGETVVYDIAFTPTADNIGNLFLNFSLNPTDEKVSNNSKTMKIEVTKGNLPVITDLRALEINADNVSLTWSSPSDPSGKTEGFEDVEPFVVDSEGNGTLGCFKRIDGDKQPVNGFGIPGADYSQVPSAWSPASFVVWSSEKLIELVNTPIYPAAEGDRLAIALCPRQDVNTGEYEDADDWLISPEVENSSKFSFYIRPVTYEFGPEKIEIMYSSASDNPEDFRILETLELQGIDDDDIEWTKYEYTLPEDAKYFAIHYVSNNAWGILLDEIELTLAGAKVEITGYDVYRNGNIIADNDACPDNVYKDTNTQAYTDYSYIVIPSLSDGTKGLSSNVLKIQTTGVSGITNGQKSIYSNGEGIIVSGYENSPISVVSIDGKVIFTKGNASNSEHIRTGSGVFVVKAKNDVAKVIVR